MSNADVPARPWRAGTQFHRRVGRSSVTSKRLRTSLARPVAGDLAALTTLATAFKSVERVFVLRPPIPAMNQGRATHLEAAVAAGSLYRARVVAWRSTVSPR